jgi:hypothetical protein
MCFWTVRTLIERMPAMSRFDLPRQTQPRIFAHPHGVFYDRQDEGAPYWDGHVVDHPGDVVPPGSSYTYTWQVPERAGPGPSDPNSIVWMYHWHVDEERDFNARPVGPIIVTARGQARPDRSPKGIDRKFVVWFAQMHEEDSWYVQRNLPTIATDHPLPTPVTPDSSTVSYPYFAAFSINGFSYNSMPLEDLTMRRGEHVRWYVMAGANGFDFHTRTGTAIRF